MSTAERIARAARAEGQAEGRTQGRTEGRVEGRAEGQLELLLRQLTARFGPLPETVLMKIRQGSDADRGRWAESVLFAPSLLDIFEQ